MAGIQYQLQDIRQILEHYKSTTKRVPKAVSIAGLSSEFGALQIHYKSGSKSSMNCNISSKFGALKLFYYHG